MDGFSMVVWWILGAGLSAVVLYVVIRLAVSHGIRDVRRRDAAATDVE